MSDATPEMRHRAKEREARDRARAERAAKRSFERESKTTEVSSDSIARGKEGFFPYAIRMIGAFIYAIPNYFVSVAQEVVYILQAPLKPFQRNKKQVKKPIAPARTADAELPVALQEIKKKRTHDLHRALLIRRLRAIGVVAFVALLVVGWQVIPSAEVFRIKHVEISGASSMSDLDLREKIDPILDGETIYTVDTNAIVKKLEALPFVRKATVDKHFPSGLTVNVIEHSPLALGYENKSDDWWLIAPDGRILSKASDREWRGRIPLVRLNSRDIKEGQYLKDEPSVNLLLAIPDDSTFSISSIEARPYSLTAKLQDGLEVRFGRPQQLRTKLAAAERIISVNRRKGINAAYVDVSVPGNVVVCDKKAACAALPAPDQVTVKERKTRASKLAAKEQEQKANIKNASVDVSAQQNTEIVTKIEEKPKDKFDLAISNSLVDEQ